jgi:hypothetical protein
MFTSSEDLLRDIRPRNDVAKATRSNKLVQHSRSRSLSLTYGPEGSQIVTAEVAAASNNKKHQQQQANQQVKIVQNGVETTLAIPLSLRLLPIAVTDEVYVFLRDVKHGIAYAEIDGAVGFLPLSLLASLRRLDVRAPAEVLSQLPSPFLSAAKPSQIAPTSPATATTTVAPDLRVTSPQVIRKRDVTASAVGSASF